MGLFGSFTKSKKESLDQGLSKTKESVFKKLGRAIVGKSKVDDEVLDNLEEVLISSDVGVDTTLKIIERIEDRVSKDKYFGVDELNQLLKEEIEKLLDENNTNDDADFELPASDNPYVIMVVGVNGVGKSTNLAKVRIDSLFELAGNPHLKIAAEEILFSLSCCWLSANASSVLMTVLALCKLKAMATTTLRRKN